MCASSAARSLAIVKSRRANDIVGFLAGVLTFTPYYHWRWEHAIHHGTAGQRCHECDPLFQQVMPITLASSLKSLAFRLWDEEGKKLVGYAHIRQRKREQQERAHPQDQPPRHRT